MNSVIDQPNSIMSAAKPAAKPKVAKKARVAPAHPPSSQMVVAAVTALKERGGSSTQAIKKYIAANYTVDMTKQGPFIRRALVKGVASGALVQTKGKGASGSFKLGKKKEGKSDAQKARIAAKKAKLAAKKKEQREKKALKTKARKEKVAAKKAAKKASKKTKKVKKPAAKKAKKPAAKKPAAKKTAAKKVAKPAKKAAKPAKKAAAKPAKKAAKKPAKKATKKAAKPAKK